MGKPAARVGDMTVHGGTIMPPGAPTVLIGGMPAACVGDNHLCPMLNPGVPPPPHVGGPIMPPGAPMVLICGKPAACVGDMATCSGPPDTIAPPGCPTVLIGSGGGGGAPLSGSKGHGAGAGVAGQDSEGHALDVSFEDKGGKPITGVVYTIKTPDGQTIDGTLTGQIKKGGVQQGSHEITLRTIVKASWSVAKAKVGDKVKLQAETAGIDSGTKASLLIYIRDANFADKLLTTIESTVNSDKIEEEWQLQVDKKLVEIQESKEQIGRYSSPSYYFIVNACGFSARSSLLDIVDDLEIKIIGDDGQPVANRKYRVYLANGEVREGKLDGSGTAQIKNVPPGQVKISVDVRE